MALSCPTEEAALRAGFAALEERRLALHLAGGFLDVTLGAGQLIGELAAALFRLGCGLFAHGILEAGECWLRLGYCSRLFAGFFLSRASSSWILLNSLSTASFCVGESFGQGGAG